MRLNEKRELTVGRVVLIIAAVVVIAAIVGVSAWSGRRLERAATRRGQNSIDPQVHRELADFARHVLGAQPIDDPAYIPEWLKAEGLPLLKKITDNRGHR